MRTISAERFVLEPQTTAHAEEMFKVLGDPAIYEYENAPPQSLEWLRERFRELETRRSRDGTEHWLNWVIRLSTSELVGYVQATVYPDGRAAIAYELASKFWHRGLGSDAVRAVIPALVEEYGVRRLTAVVRQANHRSRRLLERLGFAPAPLELIERIGIAPDEALMVREAT
jgi:RimJ/RimL family protein N-acetyltransferase